MIKWKRGVKLETDTAITMMWWSRCGNYRVDKSTYLPYLAKHHTRDTWFAAYTNGEPVLPDWHKGSIAPWSAKFTTRKAAERVCEKHASGNRPEYIHVPSSRKNKNGIVKKTTRRKITWKEVGVNA